MAVQCIYGCSDEGGEDGDGNDGSEISGGGEREWKFTGLLYANDLVLCGESKEDLKSMVGCFVEVCRGRGLKVNAGKRKVMVLGEELG